MAAHLVNANSDHVATFLPATNQMWSVILQGDTTSTKDKELHHVMSALWCAKACANKAHSLQPFNRKHITEVNEIKPLRVHGFTTNCKFQFPAATRREIFYLCEKHETQKRYPLCYCEEETAEWKRRIKTRPYASTTMNTLCQLYLPFGAKNKTKNKPAHSFFFCISPVAEPNVSTLQKFLQTHSFNPITSFQPNPVFARRLSFDCQLIEKNWHCAEEKMPIKHLLHIVQWPAVGSSLGYIWPLFMFS